MDIVGVADEVGGKVGPAGPSYQLCPISLCDGQVVEYAAGLVLNIKSSKVDGYAMPLLNLYDIRPVQVTWVVGGVVGRGQDT